MSSEYTPLNTHEEGDSSFFISGDPSFVEKDNSNLVASDSKKTDTPESLVDPSPSTLADLKKDQSIRVAERVTPEAFLVFYPGVPGHLGVLLEEPKEKKTYWSWGGASSSNEGSLSEDRKKYGQPVCISLGEFPKGQVYSLTLQINGLFGHEGIPQKYPLLLSLSLLSASLATGIYYGWDLSKIPKVGDILPTEATASIIAVTALLICLAIAYKQLIAKNKNSFEGQTFDLSGLLGYNCVGAAKKIMGELAEFSSAHKEALQELSTIRKYTPFDLAAAAYNKSALKSPSYSAGLKLENEVMQFEAGKLFAGGHLPVLDTPQKQLIQSARQLERQAAQAVTIGWFPEEAEKARRIAQNLIDLAADYALFEGQEFEQKKGPIQEEMQSLHLDLYRRLGNTGSSLFALACCGAIATPCILSHTGNFDRLPDLGTDHALAIYTAILLVSSLLATVAISKLTGAKSPFLSFSKSATALCDEISEAFKALEKTQDNISSAESRADQANRSSSGTVY